ncbi:MAG: hypothetical protein NTY77_02205 [Elusimicrobia bacterium]|nr:hypothetical protein [Elusimicrobiota bacterium]
MGLTLGAGTLAASAAEPPEFQRVDSEHFTVYSEAFYPPEGLLNELEGLHAKVSLDLVLFSPWAKDAKIELYLYKSSDSYRAQPGVKPWTAAQVDLARRRISAFQSPDLRRILAHELGHLFFDDFFLAASSGSAAGHAPRWLTEGVAVNMEWDYGLDQDRPFDPERAAKRMRPLPEFLAFDYQDDAHEARSVSDWYIQAYSLVRFLMRRFPGGLFFDLCDGLRRGLPLEEALRRAYGTAFPDLTMLERRWREDLKGG